MAQSTAVKFVILAVPRTGSNLLCTLLNSHPEILCHHEVYNPDGMFAALTHRGRDLGWGTMEERDREPLAFLERVWSTGRGYGAVGFKWTRRQNEDVLAAMVHDRSVKKIVLRRHNRIKTFISDKIAQLTQQWEVYSADDLQSPRPKIVVDRDELLEHIRTNAEFYRRLESALVAERQPFVETAYEWLFREEEQRKLLEYLEVGDPTCRLQAASVKQNPCDLRDLIANFDDCCAWAHGGELEQELNDVGS